MESGRGGVGGGPGRAAGGAAVSGVRGGRDEQVHAQDLAHDSAPPVGRQEPQPVSSQGDGPRLTLLQDDRFLRHLGHGGLLARPVGLGGLFRHFRHGGTAG